MPLSELVQADAQAILGLDGDSATMTPPTALGLAPFSAHCLHIRRSMTIDADGMAVVGAAASVTLSLGELSDNSITNPENMKSGAWAITVGGVSYRFAEVLPDYTAGVVTLLLKKNTTV